MGFKNRFPVYIVSKGRYEKTFTANILEKAGVNYLIAVEPQESELYIKKLGAEKVLILPFSNLGLGSYPARNYCWEHAKQNGFDYYWCFDDNITRFLKWINGKRQKWIELIIALKYVENHVVKNSIDIGGFEEQTFVVKPPKNPFKENCHVYSAMLIKTLLHFRWRLKYNEDVDLCLQVLHAGGTTTSCVYYVMDKVSTADKMKGGNQTELYKGNDPKMKLLKAKMLEAQWPQYAKTVIRFNRIHHFVDWRQFKKK